MRLSKYLLCFLFINGVFCLAMGQDFQGKATYQSKTTVNMDFEGREMPEEQKQRIQERMKNALNRSFELTFDRTTSSYIQEEKLETPSTNGSGRGGFRVALGGAEGELYKNIQEQTYSNQTELFGKFFLIKDSLTNWEWKLGSETKKIGNYTCYMATAVRAVDTNMLDRMRRLRPRPRGGKNRDGNNQGSKDTDTVQRDSVKTNTLLSRIELPTERTITAWYAPEIPISQGPGEYWGLPGLILEVNDGRTAILCSKIVLNPEEKIEIKIPSKGKEVTQEEFNDIMAEKMEEMSERFRSGNRRGNGNIIRIRG